MEQKPLVISFYTENTPYQLEVLHLIESCQKFGIESDISGIPCRGSWEQNCAFKPFFLRDKLKTCQRPLFWVDADAIFRKHPDFSSLLHADIAFREMKRFFSDRRFRLFSGSLFLNHTERALQLVEKWCALCQKQIDDSANLEFLDQKTLLDLMEQEQNLKVCTLPITYAKVFDIDASEVDPEEVVVEHFQASRRFRFFKP